EMWENGQYWRLFTAMFLHYGATHLFMNGLSLWMVGRAIEFLYGPAKMLVIYLMAGMAGSAASAMFGQPESAAVGASGAIMGLLGAVIWYRISAPDGDRIAWRPLVTTLGLNAALGIMLHDVIDNWAHGGGLAGGFLMAALVGVPAISGMPRPRYQPARLWRGLLSAAAIATAILVAAGAVVLPGPGRGLAAAYYNFEQGDYPQAEAGLRRALQVQDSPEIRLNLLITYLIQNKCSEARAELVRFSAQVPNYPDLPKLQAAVRQCATR
ncbi:MAG TPA: rhomboid family intramembrane serine protease, partial [Symbiobacteriaceae bacterium]|nr:rhomboid family intramembrane serine protease [Symbiobacteriaceae bacterium]